jgi:hypothetical protein
MYNGERPDYEMPNFQFEYKTEDCDQIIDSFAGLALMYNGKEVEGITYTYVEPKPPVFKELVFSLDGKKYKFLVEEID